jgi:regulator of RNase E activity RraA
MADDRGGAIAPETVERLRRVGTATLTTLLLKRGIKGCFLTGVRALNPSDQRAARFVGEAFTLRFVPAREDMTRPDVLANPDYPQRRAVETTPPGHVLVVDCRGDRRAGVIGGILAARLRARGVVALVADGAVRDAADLMAMPWPVFCAGAAAPASIAVHHAADIQRPIACGGAAVFPGDVMVGDADGVVVLPRALAPSLADEAVEQERIERFIEERVAAGAALPGLYPPNEEALADYRHWLAASGAAPEDG